MFDYGWEANPITESKISPPPYLHSATLTQSHKDRAYLALVLLLRHGGGLRDRSLPWLRLLDLLPKSHLRHGIVVGEALRLAYKISGGMPALLASTRLSVQNLELTLHINQSDLAALPTYMKHP